MKKAIAVVAGLVCIFVGAGLILPALAKVRDHGSMPSEVVGLYTLGVLLTVAGIASVALGFRRSRSLKSPVRAERLGVK